MQFEKAILISEISNVEFVNIQRKIYAKQTKN